MSTLVHCNLIFKTAFLVISKIGNLHISRYTNNFVKTRKYSQCIK